MPRRLGGFVAVLLVALTPPARADQAHDANVHQFWEFDGLRAVRLEQSIRITEIANSTYFSMPVWFDNSSNGAYMGLQQLDHGQRIALFALWDAVSFQPGAPGSTCEPFGGEGTGLHCKLPYAFALNRWYTLRLLRTARDATGSTWSAWIVDDARRATLIGRLKTKPGVGDIYTADSFDEYFGPAVACSLIPKSSATFGAPRINGASWPQTRFSVRSIGRCSGPGRAIQNAVNKTVQLRLGR